MQSKIIEIFTLLIGLLASFSYVNAQNVPNFDNTPKGGVSGQTIAFVAEKIGLEEVEESCPQDYICMDIRYNARYRIIELLEGEYENDVIDFVVYDHYGKPRFSNHERVVLYVYQTDDGFVHHKYSFDALNRVKDGNYAYCGDPYADYDVAEVEENGREDLTPFDFSPPIKFKISKFLPNKADMADIEQEDIRDEFLEVMRKFAPPAFKIKGNTAICKMGMTANALASVRMKYDFIPKADRSLEISQCLKESGLPNNSVTLAQLEKFNTCIEELK